MISTIELWLLGGVIFSVGWALYKAFQYDAEKLDERVRRLENNEEDLYLQIRGLRNKLKSQSQDSLHKEKKQ